MSASALERFVIQARRLKQAASTREGGQPRRLVADEVPETCFAADWVAAHGLAARFPVFAGVTDDAAYGGLHGQMSLRMDGEERRLTIEHLAGEGRRAFVYRALSETGDVYALKVVRAMNRENLYAIQVEPERLRYLAELGLGVPVVHDCGSDYLIKDWVPGEVGDTLSATDSLDGQHIDALLSFISRCIQHNLKIWDLKPRNLVYSGGQWVCIDPGRLSVGESKRFLIRYYKGYVLSHWFKLKPISMRYAALNARLLFRRSV